MADSGKSGGDGEEVLYQVISIIVVIFIIGSLLSGLGFNIFSNDSNSNLTFTQRVKTFSLSSAFPSGTIKLGDNVINKKDVDVYRDPAQQIVGTQSKREVGKPIQGPVEQDSRTWWRIDYKEAPDGWVKESSLTDYVWTYRLFNFFPIVFGALVPFLLLLSIILFILIVVVMVKSNKLYELKQKKLEMYHKKDIKSKIAEESKAEDKKDKTFDEIKEEEENPLFKILPTGGDVPKTKDVHNKRWAHVETLMNSHNVNDWKQAIIEADIILDEMMERMGYKGNSIGDKLKTVEESDFLTLNQAWEAHKIRNRIAHKGSNYTLTRNDAERAFELYKEVFREFYFI